MIRHDQDAPTRTEARADVHTDHPRRDCPHRDGAYYMRCACRAGETPSLDEIAAGLRAAMGVAE